MATEVWPSAVDADLSPTVVGRAARRAQVATSTRSAQISLGAITLTLLLAALATSRRPDEVVPALALSLMGATAFVALVAASFELRSHRLASWTASRRDPFLALAAAMVLLVAPQLTALVAGPSANVLQGYPWLTGGLATACGAIAFLVMIRDLTPGHALDALYLAAIGATTVGLVAWTAILSLVSSNVVASPPAFGLLALVVLDLWVVGLAVQALHLRARARQGCWLFVLAWTFVLVSDVSALAFELTDAAVATGPRVAVGLIAYGLFAAGAVNPDTKRAAEPIMGSLRRLPRSQIALLGVAVLLGPLVSVALGQGVSLRLIVPLSAALSLLVVTYLVRLVQGRAVLDHRAHHDELTGLANRRLFEERAAGAISFARRSDGYTAVLFLDLDRFKNVNDSLGHAAGNLLLQAVAKRLHGATRAEDTVARLGGDEFVVLLPQLDDPRDATTIATKILQRFDAPFRLDGHEVFASPSIGIATFPTDGEDADALLENADIAMYQAKERGRRTFCTYHRSMNDHARARLALEGQMHNAIERGELRLHYQPKLRMPGGHLSGMEALLRWEHPELGLLQPADFIPLAEESGLIVPVGEWALEEACRQNQEWVTAGYPPLVVAVNLSLRQFQQQHVEDVTARILRATGLAPELLQLEVTESLAMQDPEGVRATLVDLKALGVSCSIDDFGTGYSGLNHLTGFPIDKLKIDKSFVATIDTDREAPIVVAVVALAHGLGLEVVAEGVETAEQLERLRELGCDEVQGFLFSRPVPAPDFERLLETAWCAPPERT